MHHNGRPIYSIFEPMVIVARLYMGYHAIHGNHMVSAYIHVVEMKLYCETKYFGAKYGIPCHTYIHICMYVYMYIKH